MFICSPEKVNAQVRPTQKMEESKHDSIKTHSAGRASIFSALIPGLGQAYNRKYWKIPILYAGFAGLSYLASFNQIEYKKFKDAIAIRNDGNPNTVDDYSKIRTDDDLALLVDIYRRDRDLSFIGIFAVYLLNVVDAAVDAHLYNFDVSDNLSLNWHPQVNPNPLSGYGVAGISICLNLKK